MTIRQEMAAVRTPIQARRLLPKVEDYLNQDPPPADADTVRAEAEALVMLVSASEQD